MFGCSRIQPVILQVTSLSIYQLSYPAWLLMATPTVYSHLFPGNTSQKPQCRLFFALQICFINLPVSFQFMMWFYHHYRLEEAAGTFLDLIGHLEDVSVTRLVSDISQND